MAKVKYYYDSETLSYQKIKPKKGQKIKGLLLFLVAGFVFMMIGFLVLTPIFESPKEKELKRELEFVKLNEELHAKKIQFFTNISHEFRTPLTLMLNPLESLLSAPDVTALPDDVRAKHRIIHRKTKRMKRLIDELMDFRKLQFNKMSINASQINIVPWASTRTFIDSSLHMMLDGSLTSFPLK